MLHEVLSGYSEQVEQAVLECRDAYVEQYVEEVVTDERINPRIRLRMKRGHLLEISEAVVFEGVLLAFLDYRYHFQDGDNHMMFRYDSTPHYRSLPSFPDHKHVLDGVITSTKPTIQQVIREAITEMRQELYGHSN